MSLATGDRDQLAALAFATDNLLRVASNQWGWLALEFYVYLQLMGEDVDYGIDDSDEEWNAGKKVGLAVWMHRMGVGGDKDLPKKMGKLGIQDADGDVEMAD
ncbi:hypothetical protein MMYC01_208941 [Madurella mycetomatis]|uniref:Uncharacterized protein n=1 Tax=Madurella mycetomatis TaxID=100816 RepID=A0A175VUN8_9PEZI|nr:hypothetical protein MMYC01_208941 [Madurella mycetomatis]